MAHPKLWGTTDTRNGLPTTTRESSDFSHGECQIEVFIEAIKKASIRSPHRSLNVLKLDRQFKDKYNYIILRFTKKFNSLSSEDKKFLSDVCMNIFGLTIIALINFTMLFLMIEYNI